MNSNNSDCLILHLPAEVVAEMNSNNSDCLILHLPAEVVEKICKYLRPNDVCQLDETCSRMQKLMNQELLWKWQIKSFPVAGIPFGDSTKATWRKCRERDDYFNKRFLHLLTEWPAEQGRPDFHQWGEGVNAYRIAVKTKFILDKMLGEVKDYFDNDFKDDVKRWKEEATRNPDSSPDKYPLKSFQVQVSQEIHKEDTLNMCEWYLKKWMYFGKLYSQRRIDFNNLRMVSRHGNVFKIEPVLYYGNLIQIENDSSESSDDEEEEADDDRSDDEEEEADDDSDNDEEEDADDDSDDDMEEEADDDSDASEDV